MITDLDEISQSSAISQSNGICRQLGVSEAVLRSAEQTYPLHTEGAPANRFMYALKDWHNGNGRIDDKPVPVTYAVLCEALEQSRYRQVSEDLKKC